MESTPDTVSNRDEAEAVQPLRDEDATAPLDPDEDPAQAEWDRTEAIDSGVPEDELDTTTETGRDPAEIPDADDEIPAEDLPDSESQPESQGDDPVIAELGEDGEGDLAPEDI